MERLTEKTVGCFEYALKDHKAVSGEFGTYDAFFDYSMAVKRLGHYEELMERWKLRSIEEADRIFQRVNTLGGTDLMAQYRALGSIGHLRDLLQAEQDGRLVVLPCKAGAHVWVDGREAVVENFFGYETERYLYAQFYDNMQCIDIPFTEIGKTVFLTREEAEAAMALKGGESDA